MARAPIPSGGTAEQLARVEQQKKRLRGTIASLGVRPLRTVERLDAAERLLRLEAPPLDLPIAPASRSMRAPAGESARDPRVRSVRSEVTFNAVSRINVFRTSGEVEMSLENLAPLIDPRAWSRSQGVISMAYRLEVDDAGEYQPMLERPAPRLGTPWRGKRPWLLFEYARTEAASFENILEIKTFSVTPGRIFVRYRLHDCLKCMLGFLALDGGLQMNEGFIKATPTGERGWSRIMVEKRVRARDFTSGAPGDGFDTGQWINATIGVALSLWVEDQAMFSPLS